MKRYRAFDPPEYVDWTPDPEVMDAFSGRAEQLRRMADLNPGRLLDLYRELLVARLHDIYLKRWVKNGVITKAWLATGEEAVTVGSVAPLRTDGPFLGDDAKRDAVGPMIRNAYACIAMGIPLHQMFGAYLGSADTRCRGRDLHIGDLDYGVVAPVSHVGSLAPVMVGVALGFSRAGSDRVAMTWVGDGASKTGEFHEALGFAAALDLPVVIIVQNNQIALGTRTADHHPGSFATMGQAYGLPTVVVDGNHVLDVYVAANTAVQRARAKEGPTLIVAETFRMGGHATHDEAEGRRIVAAEEFETWGKRDPIGCYEAWLVGAELEVDGKAVDRALLDGIDEAVTSEMEAASQLALSRRADHQPDPTALLDGIYSA